MGSITQDLAQVELAFTSHSGSCGFIPLPVVFLKEENLDLPVKTDFFFFLNHLYDIRKQGILWFSRVGFQNLILLVDPNNALQNLPGIIIIL